MQIAMVGLGRMGGNMARRLILSSALYVRFRWRQEHTFAERVLSAMRQKFGGHVERAAGG